MYISKTELKKILTIAEQFADAEDFELEQDGSFGIGTITTLLIHTNINGHDGIFSVEISGTENW